MSGDGEARSLTGGPRHRPRGRRVLTFGSRLLAALISIAAVVATGVGWMAYRSASAGITTSEALAGEPASPGTDQNILIMGLDSRRDQQGRPLPPDILDALHAGGEDAADGDADALIVVHLPAGDGPVTAISIPRDDYVDLAGCTGSDCRGKVKQAYSFAYQRVMQSGSSTAAGHDAAAREQAAREAGRKAEIGTVRRLLQIPIDHFIEVTLAGFFQLARVVEPITVCLKADTADTYYSGADFHQGTQQISAAQAMAFVRQRRDADDAAFTDLDRSRRQQAFLASLISALRHGGALSSPGRLSALLDVAKRNVAVDAGFDLDDLARNASAMQDRPVALYTLPVTGFGTISDGEDVNFIDVTEIRSIVRDLVGADASTAPATGDPGIAAPTGEGTPLAAGGVRLDVVNASGTEGEAARLEKTLAVGHFSTGEVSTADSTSQTTTIAYGPGAKAAATELADDFGLSAMPFESVPNNTVRLTVGTDFSRFDNGGRTSTSSVTTTASAPVTTVSATGTGTQEPAPTNLTRMSADGIPCVK